MMNLEELFQRAINELETDRNPDLGLTSQDREELRRLIRGDDHGAIRMALCLMTYDRPLHLDYEQDLIQLLKTPGLPADLHLFAWGVIGHHSLPLRKRDGEKQPAGLIEAMRLGLHHPDIEVKLAVLELLAQIGGQAIILKKEILGIKPLRLIAFFNRTKTSLYDLIVEFENKWKER